VGVPFRTQHRVRCLVCREQYSKPRGPGTIEANPGCPVCGYVGWEPAKLFTVSERLRFSAGLRLLRSA
jgi:hypothetical protein